MFLRTRQIILQLLKRNQGGAGEGNTPHLRICAKGLDWYRDKILIFR